MRKALSRIAAFMGIVSIATGSTPTPNGQKNYRGSNPDAPKPRGFKYTRTPYAENGMSRHKQKMKCRIYCAPKKRKK